MGPLCTFGFHGYSSSQRLSRSSPSRIITKPPGSSSVSRALTSDSTPALTSSASPQTSSESRRSCTGGQWQLVQCPRLDLSQDTEPEEVFPFAERLGVIVKNSELSSTMRRQSPALSNLSENHLKHPWGTNLNR
jgi:hypothetical protein